jgi:hypothetical protein
VLRSRVGPHFDPTLADQLFAFELEIVSSFPVSIFRTVRNRTWFIEAPSGYDSPIHHTMSQRRRPQKHEKLRAELVTIEGRSARQAAATDKHDMAKIAVLLIWLAGLIAHRNPAVGTNGRARDLAAAETLTPRGKCTVLNTMHVIPRNVAGP